MRLILRILGTLLSVAVLLGAGLAALYFSYRQPIPDLARAQHVDTRLAEGVAPGR